jgi:hypothetical protein
MFHADCSQLGCPVDVRMQPGIRQSCIWPMEAEQALLRCVNDDQVRSSTISRAHIGVPKCGTAGPGTGAGTAEIGPARLAFLYVREVLFSGRFVYKKQPDFSICSPRKN